MSRRPELAVRNGLFCLQDWAYFKMKFTKGGRESLLREILKLDIETIPADVAQRAKEVIADMSEERVKCVSLAGAGLYTWVRISTSNYNKILY